MKKYSSYQKLFRATLATTVATGALVAAVPAFSVTADAKSTSFSDVKEGHHFYEGVMNLTARGVINGYTDGTYRPGENITRAQAAKILASALDLDTKNVKDPGFKDVKKGHRFYGEIAALVDAGVIKGFNDGTFRPDGNLTRSQMSQLLVLGFDFEVEKHSNLPFKDVNSGHWFANYIQTLYSNEITAGTTATTFSPDAIVTRGQVAAFVYKSGLKQSKGIEVIGFADGKLELADGTYNVHDNLQDIINEANLPALKGAIVKVKVENDTVVRITSIELKAKGTASNAVTLDGNGSTFIGNVIVNGDYISLKNLTIKGNLEIGKQVENSFTADKLTVTGKTIISDKAAATAAVYSIAAEAKAPTFTFNNSTIGTVEVTKKGATVEAKGTTKVEEIVLSSNVTVKADAGITIPKVSVTTGAAQVTLDANIGTLSINSTGNLTLAGTGNIKEVKVESNKDVNFETKGKIENLSVASKDSKISLSADTRVGDITLPAGSSAEDIIQDYDKAKENIEKVDGETNPDAKPETPAVGGGGGGSFTPPTASSEELLNQLLLQHVGAGNASGAVSIELKNKVFNVNINNKDATLDSFSTAAKTAFLNVKGDVIVNTGTVNLRGETITVGDINNDQPFETIISKALSLVGLPGNTPLSLLDGKSITIAVSGKVYNQPFNNVPYTFEFNIVE